MKIYQEIDGEADRAWCQSRSMMLALAEHYGKRIPTEAAKLYAQIKSEYPDTAIADTSRPGDSPSCQENPELRRMA